MSKGIRWTKSSRKHPAGPMDTYRANVGPAGEIRIVVTNHIHGEPGHYYGMVQSPILNMNDMTYDLGTDAEKAKANWIDQIIVLLGVEQDKLRTARGDA